MLEGPPSDADPRQRGDGRRDGDLRGAESVNGFYGDGIADACAAVTDKEQTRTDRWSATRYPRPS